MAVSVSTGTTKGRSNDVWGARRVTLLRVTLDNAYTTNGVAFDPKRFGHQGKADSVLLFPRYSTTANKGTHGIFFQYDHTNKKILAFWDSAVAGAARLTEVVNGEDLSGCVLDVVVLSD